MADIAALKIELTAGHPDTGPYDADDAVAADQLNVVNRTQNRVTMTASEVFNAIDTTDYAGLSPEEQQEIWNILHLGEINPFGREATYFTDIFGVQSVTITALKAARKTNVSRAAELGLGRVRAGEVMEARL